MAEKVKPTTQEGGTDFQGLQDFIVTVDTTGFEETEPEVILNTGEETTDPKVEDQPDPSKETTEDPKKETEEPKKEQPKKEETPQVDQSQSYYGKLAKKYLEKGKWQDAEITTESGVVKLSELDEVDEETFFAIEESQSKFNQEDIKTNYIKKDAFDENKLKIIEILKEGGDLKDIFKTPEEAKRPFEGVDIEDSQVQKTVFYNYLTQVQKLNPEDAKVVLANHEKRNEIDGKVKEIVGGYQKQYDNQLTQKLEQIKAEKAEKAQKDKEFSKSLQDIYTQYELDEKLVKKFSTLATKRSDDGEFELDSVYAQKMEDPKEAADLVFFLTDKEGYLKSKMTETRVGTQQENLRKINLVKPKQGKDDKATSSDSSEARNEFVIKVPME